VSQRREPAAGSHAIVIAPLTAVRAEPGHRAEQVSQETLGSALRLLERSGSWVHCRGEDDYEGWVHVGGLVLRAEEAEAWWDDFSGAPAISLDAALADESGEPFMLLPWGARIALEGSLAHLPDGRSARLVAGRCVRWDKLSADFPQEGAAVAATAREWLGVPYVWGGRTRWGADCSGFVQAVFRLHGFTLPRDSHQQAEIGEPVEADRDLAGLDPGDLLYFRGRETPRVVHVALSLGRAKMLHAAEANGCVAVNDLGGGSELESSLAERLVGVRRIFWSK
jgi:hypothetical protein